MDRTDQLNKMQENYQNQRQMNLRRQLSISISKSSKIAIFIKL